MTDGVVTPLAPALAEELAAQVGEDYAATRDYFTKVCEDTLKNVKLEEVAVQLSDSLGKTITFAKNPLAKKKKKKKNLT